MELSTDTALPPRRGPLVEKPNSPPPTPTSVKQIRRKSSFIRRFDSSDDFPSPHASIFEAYLLSATNSDESSNRVEQIQMVPFRQAADSQGKVTISNVENKPVIQKADFRYGHGTVLDTISEQKSVATLRTLYRPKSADDVKSFAFKGHRDTLLVTPRLGRKCSHSLDDLHLVEYHEVCHEIYASPKVPIRDPVERPSTPPGMPSWTASQTPPPAIPQRPYHTPRTPNRLQRLFGIVPSGVTFSSRVPRPGTERVVPTPSPMGRNQRAPRFRPPRSAYGNLARHPFNNAPIAPVPQACSPNKKVRFTPSATARDSAETNLRNAMESTSTLAIHPMAPFHTMTPMVPIGQKGSTAMKRQICMHRNNKDAALTNAGTISVQTSIEQSTRFNSVSSTTPLMSGALSPQRLPTESCATSPVIEGGLISQDSDLNQQNLNRVKDGMLNWHERSRQFVPCWKCLFEKLARGRFWNQTASCLCFVCCGYECDDESTVYGAYGYDTGNGYFDQDRRYVLEQTPASMV